MKLALGAKSTWISPARGPAKAQHHPLPDSEFRSSAQPRADSLPISRCQLHRPKMPIYEMLTLSAGHDAQKMVTMTIYQRTQHRQG